MSEDAMKTSSAISSSESSERQCLSFMSLVELAKDVFYGGVLVTDSQSKPIEFRCTSPIKPNPVQKTLYGETLRKHMCVELTAQPIKDALQEQLNVIFIYQTEFWEFRRLIDFPLLLVKKQGEDIVSSPDSQNAESKVISPDPNFDFDPITVTCHPDYPDDMSILPIIGNHIDLIEPFTRIRSAVELVHQKKGQ